jgi:hypothetical protein
MLFKTLAGRASMIRLRYLAIRLLTVVAVAQVAASHSALAQSFDPPSVKAGDSWTYRDVTEKGANGWVQTEDQITVSRVTASSIYYSARQSGSTQAPRDRIAGRDWSRSRDVNGKETVVNRPLSFPLAPGKTWELEYREERPNKDHRFEEFYDKYTVVGMESIEVPAGKFNALKIEAEGRWTAQMEPSQVVVQGAKLAEGDAATVSEVHKTAATASTGRIYKAFWYAPEVKRWVKSVEEYYGKGGVRNERYTGELESFNPAGQ